MSNSENHTFPDSFSNTDEDLLIMDEPFIADDSSQLDNIPLLDESLEVDDTTLELEVDIVPILKEIVEPQEKESLTITEVMSTEVNLLIEEDIPSLLVESIDSTTAHFSEDPITLSVEMSHLSNAPAVESDIGYSPEQEDSMDNDKLTGIEEIQTLPLAEMILDDDHQPSEHAQKIAALESIVFDGNDPSLQLVDTSTDHSETPDTPASTPSAVESASSVVTEHTASPEGNKESATVAKSSIEPAPAATHQDKTAAKKSENPFLPQHILDRLNQGKRNLVEEIAQSSAALDASTAILRTHARSDRLSKLGQADAAPAETPIPSHPARDKVAQHKQKVLDDLVEEYLPLLTAELRRRLRRHLDDV